MAVPRSIRWLTRQRVPTSELTFRDLAGESRWLLAFACLYVLASCLTGFLISHFRMPIWSATDILQDVWYTVFFKVGLLLVLPLVVYRSWGYRFGDLLYGWRPTLRSIAVMAVCYAVGFSIVTVGTRAGSSNRSAPAPSATTAARTIAAVFVCRRSLSRKRRLVSLCAETDAPVGCVNVFTSFVATSLSGRLDGGNCRARYARWRGGARGEADGR